MCWVFSVLSSRGPKGPERNVLEPKQKKGCLDTSGNFYVLMTTAPRPFRGSKRPKCDNSHFWGPFWPPRSPGDGRDGSSGIQNTSTQCTWVQRIDIMHLGPLTDLYGTSGAPKGLILGPNGPFGGPGGPRRAPGRGEYISKNFYFCTTPKNGSAQESCYAW